MEMLRRRSEKNIHAYNAREKMQAGEEQAKVRTYARCRESRTESFFSCTFILCFCIVLLVNTVNLNWNHFHVFTMLLRDYFYAFICIFYDVIVLLFIYDYLLYLHNFHFVFEAIFDIIYLMSFNIFIVPSNIAIWFDIY